MRIFHIWHRITDTMDHLWRVEVSTWDVYNEDFEP